MYMFGTASTDPVKALAALNVNNWKNYLSGKLPSPYVFISSEQRAQLENSGQMELFLKAAGNPVFMSKMFHQEHYETLMEEGLLTGNGLCCKWATEPVLFYSCADGEDLTGNRAAELTPAQRLEHLQELENQ